MGNTAQLLKADNVQVWGCKAVKSRGPVPLGSAGHLCMLIGWSCCTSPCLSSHLPRVVTVMTLDQLTLMTGWAGLGRPQPFLTTLAGG